eukprot:m.86870 g.86870  ORF g.86870 m.86870 type:complete len:130 (+) comp16378_c0_seq1:391-780(+)
MPRFYPQQPTHGRIFPIQLELDATTLPPLRGHRLSTSGTSLGKSRPLDGTETKLLQTASPHVKKGRTWQYLKYRQDYEPQERYQFPMTSTQLMSWGVDDELRTTQKSIYAKKRIVKNSFYSKNNSQSHW